jgi:hypothetical protein
VAGDVQDHSTAGEVQFVAVVGFVVDAARWRGRNRARHRRVQRLLGFGQ